MRVAKLSGTVRQPEVRLTFDRADTHPVSGEPLTDWVKRAPRRHWDRDTSEWVITAFGGTKKDPKVAKNPETVLRRAGFTVLIDESWTDVLSLEDLVAPVCRQSRNKPAMALVRPRFAGWDVAREILGLSAVWDRDRQWFEVPLAELLVHGEPKRGLVVDKATVEAARATLVRRHDFGSEAHDNETLLEDAAAMAFSTGIDLTDAHTERFDRLVDVVGDVPDWFGLDLYPYQRLGAIAALAGRNFIADPTGLGKTRQALAALAIRDVDRAVLVVPPVVLTNWARECEASHLAATAPKPLTKAEIRRREKAGESTDVTPVVPGTPDGVSPRLIAAFKPGRKEPELPERGIVIVGDSLLASRPALRNKIAAWGPDALVYDEAHRARTWSSARAKAIREMCSMLDPGALRLPMTATPLFSNPAELASLLAISGHLDPVFGGYTAFVDKFCRRNHFNALVARKNELPVLRRMLADQVWVRRRKDEVLADLPTVSRRAQFLDVDLAGFRAAHDEVIAKILLWLDEWVASEGEYPNDDDISTFSRSQIGLMSPLRKAAGLAKVPAALDMISDWIDDEVTLDVNGDLTCDRPLLVWAHHHEVVDAIVEHAAGHLKETARAMVGVIAGSTPADRRGYYVDEFQAGRLPILVASISAAGVGITLTRGSDQVFVESSYSVPEVSQAIDRQNRIGQERPVMVTTLLAEGTLDARLQQILNTKSDIINTVLGDGGADVSVVSDSDLDDKAAPSEIIAGLVHVAIEQHRKGKVGPKKAADQERVSA